MKKILSEFESLEYEIESELSGGSLDEGDLNEISFEEYLDSDPSMYVNQFLIKFIGVNSLNDGKSSSIAKFHIKYIKIIDLLKYKEVYLPDVFDSIDQSLFNFYEELFDYNGLWFRDSIQINEKLDILYLDSIEINEKFSDFEIGELLNTLQNIFRYNCNIKDAILIYKCYTYNRFELNINKYLLEKHYKRINDTKYIYRIFRG